MDKQGKVKPNEVEKDLNKKYINLLEFIKQNNPDITFGVVFSVEEGRKHRLWCGGEKSARFRISLKFKGDLQNG